MKDIIGHTKALTYLKSNIENNNLSHAYLFIGPEGVGKYTIANRFAKNLQATDVINNFNNDVFIINELPSKENYEKKLEDTNIPIRNEKKDKERKTNSIILNDIQVLIKFLNQSSFSKFKIVIIKNIERMVKEAYNSLLKTLEEPPSNNTIFILTSSSISFIPKTIISRCRILNFSTVSEEKILDGLKNLGYKTDTLTDLIKHLPKAPGKIINLLEDSNQMELYFSIWQEIKKLLTNKNNLVEKFKFIEKLTNKNTNEGNQNIKEKALIFLNCLYYYLYNQFNSKTKTKDNIKTLQNKIKFIQNSQILLRRNVNIRLILENIMLIV